MIIMKKNIKTLVTLTALSTGLLGAVSSFASTPATPPDPVTQILTAINNNVQVVGNQMQSLAEANTAAEYATPANLSIAASAVINPALLTVMGLNNLNLLNGTTATSVTSQLQPLSDNLLEVGSSMINSNVISQRLIADSNLKTNLSTQLPASDTIYSNDPTVLQISGNYTSELPAWGIAQPPILNDNYFNFASLMQPLAYTDGGAAAEAFLDFITQRYNNPSTPINYSAFQTKLGQASTPADKMSLYIQLLQDNNYINYQLSTRSAVASRSVAINNFQNLSVERTPVTGLGVSAGLPNTPNASPLQVESYLATRRANSPSWYTQVQTESPASVQRETLVVLAEIEAQNFQAHLDSERLLATLSAQAANAGAVQSQLNAAQASQVNTDIQSFTIPSQTTPNSNGSGQ